MILLVIKLPIKSQKSQTSPQINSGTIECEIKNTGCDKEIPKEI